MLFAICHEPILFVAAIVDLSYIHNNNNGYRQIDNVDVKNKYILLFKVIKSFIIDFDSILKLMFTDIIDAVKIFLHVWLFICRKPLYAQNLISY